MRKTHVVDSPNTGRRYNNCQLTHGFSVGWSGRVPDGVSDVELKTTNCSQSIQNFRKTTHWDLIGHITHKTHVPDFSDSTSSSHKLRFKFTSCNSVG
jgi:hypothetical protein